MAKEIGVKAFENKLAEYLKIVVPPGSVQAFAGTAPPSDWLICDGRTVSRTTYSDLFEAIGTSHGIGDGSTTFNLPDYRGMFLRGRVDINTILGSGTVPALPNNTQATFTNHGINRTGFRVRLSSGTLGGLAASTDYFAIVVDNNTLAFATTLANALAGTRITLTASSANTAVIVQYEDPDASSRAAATVGGNTGNAVGSVQDHQFASHIHSISTGSAGGAVFNSVIGPTNGVLNGSSTSSSSGGTETRPKNSLINYIIKI
jgi:microcystin-dependent protein